MGLLEDGKAKRMLISGVSRHVTRSELQTITGASKPVYDCCVDLGFQATNTLGNAPRDGRLGEVARATARLILVTADYHMPRAAAGAASGPAGGDRSSPIRWPRRELKRRRLVEDRRGRRSG